MVQNGLNNKTNGRKSQNLNENDQTLHFLYDIQVFWKVYFVIKFLFGSYSRTDCYKITIKRNKRIAKRKEKGKLDPDPQLA